MIAMLLGLAHAQTRLEMTVTSTAYSGTVPILSYELEDQRSASFGQAGGGGASRRSSEALIVQLEVGPATTPLWEDVGALAQIDSVVLRAYQPHPNGTQPDLLVQEVSLTLARVVRTDLTGRATDALPRQKVQFNAQCTGVTAFAYDATGTQTGASTSVFDYAGNQSGCLPQ